MFRNNQLKLGRANFTIHPVSHRDQNRQLDDGSRLNRRVMRNVANRASRVGTPRVMVREIDSVAMNSSAKTATHTNTACILRFLRFAQELICRS